jgi:spermidine synthase
MKRLPAKLLPYAAFFLSGASSLIFQTIWTRMLHHVFGATSVAISTVLTVFMAGLGLGAYLGGRYAKRIKHPLIAYAVAELGVGVWGLLVPLLVESDGWLAEVNAALRASFGAESSLFLIARFVCVVPILLVPTTLMGSTLPLLTRHFVTAQEDAGEASKQVGALYAINTFGAATGPLLSAFLLMPTVGLAVTNVVACSMNFSLAAMIWFGRRLLLEGTWKPGEPLRFWPEKEVVVPEAVAPATEGEAEAIGDAAEDAAAPEATPKRTKKGKKRRKGRKGALEAESEIAVGAGEAPAAAGPTEVPAMARWAALVAFGVSGAAALAYEVVWSRALAMTIGSSIYSFALILETFLVGIAVGSAAMSAFLGKPSLRGVAGVSVGMVLLANVGWAIAPMEETSLGPTSRYLLLSACFVAPIVLALVYDRSLELAQAPRRPFLTPALVMAGMPLLAAIVAVTQLEGTLNQVIASVVSTVVVLLVLVTLLRKSPILLIALVQLFIAGATVVSYLWQDEIPYAFAQLVTSIPQHELPDHVNLVQGFMFLTASLCTLPATLGMGAMFPLTVRLWTSGGEDIARDVSVVYATNTVGSILGSWLPGFVLFAAIGAEHTLHVGVALNMVMALVMLIAGAADESDAGPGEGRRKGERRRGDLPVWHAATVYVLSPLIPALMAYFWLQVKEPTSPWRWNLTQMTLGVFRVSLAEGMLDRESWGRPEIRYYRDGLTTTVSVEAWVRHLALKNNGKVDASNGDDMPTQINVAAYPLLLHPDGPEDLDLAVVGFGSGVSVGTALQFPVARVDVIELERAIPEAARYFADVNQLDYNLEEWPYVEMDRLTVINDDGRNYLASTRRDYDVIISEPSNPWITGVSDLFTVDHFRITKQRLRPGGIYCQWVQLYELSPENIKTIYRTFASQFEHVLVLSADDRSSDTVMLGSDQPIRFDLERIDPLFQSPPIRTELERANLYSPYDLFSRTLFATRDEVLAYTRVEERWGEAPEPRGFVDRALRPVRAALGDREAQGWGLDYGATNAGDGCQAPGCRRVPVPLNTDDNARIEFAAPRDLIGFRRYENYLATIYGQEWPWGRPDPVLTGFGEGDEAASRYAELAMSFVAHGRYRWAADFIERAQAEGSSRETAVAVEVLAHLLTADREPSPRISPPIPGPEMDPRNAARLVDGFDAVRQALDGGQLGQAMVAMESIPAPLRQHSGPSLRFLEAYLLYKTADRSLTQYAEAIERLEGIAQTDPAFANAHPELYYFLAKCHDAEGNGALALRAMRAYVEARLVAVGPETAAIEEPAEGTAPHSDAPGEVDKTEHDDRG